MALAPEVQRQLDIKSNVVKRITKELELYRKEADDETAKVASLKASNADPYGPSFVTPTRQSAPPSPPSHDPPLAT